MAWLKRIGLFMLVNILVVFTISLVLNVLGVRPYLNAYGMDYQSLAIFCLVWGMGGAFISLALSRVMAKWMMGVQVIPADVRDPELRSLVEVVHQLSRSAQLPTMPEVGIYDSPEPNAFATGPTKSRALVAVSTGLMRSMNAEQLRGVLGHEVSHVANGDMVTMTLIQGVINAFVMFASRAIAFALTQGRDSEGRREGSRMSFYIVSMILEVVFMILGSLVVAWFSRQREYRADKGGARLAGRDSMIHALQGLQRTFDVVADDATPAVQTLKISSHGGGLLALFSTHPPLDERIARLQSYTA